MKKTTSLLIAIAVSSVAMGAGWGDDIYTGSAFAGFEAGYAKPKVQIYGVNGRSDDSGKSSYFGARLGSYWSNTTRAYFSLSYIRQDDAHLKYNNPTTAGGTPSPAPPSPAPPSPAPPSPAPPSPAPPASGNSTSAANAVGYSTPQPNSNAITYNNINIGHPPTSTVTPAINVPYAVPYPTPSATPPLAPPLAPPLPTPHMAPTPSATPGATPAAVPGYASTIPTSAVTPAINVPYAVPYPTPSATPPLAPPLAPPLPTPHMAPTQSATPGATPAAVPGYASTIPTSTVTPAINVPYAVPYPTPGAIPPLAPPLAPPLPTPHMAPTPGATPAAVPSYASTIPTSTVTPAINVPYAVPYPTPGAIPPLAASQLPPSYTSTSIPGPDTRANSNTDDYTIHAIKQLNLQVSTDYLFMPEREYHPFVGLTLGATQTKARGSSLPTTVTVEANGRFEKNWTLSYGAQAGVIYQIDNIDLEAGLKYLTNHSSNHYDHKHDVRLKVNDSRQIYAAASIRF